MTSLLAAGNKEITSKVRMLCGGRVTNHLENVRRSIAVSRHIASPRTISADTSTSPSVKASSGRNLELFRIIHQPLWFYQSLRKFKNQMKLFYLANMPGSNPMLEGLFELSEFGNSLFDEAI